MPSGKQLAEQNYQTFIAWIASKTDEELRQLAGREVLSRKKIAKECAFAKSVLDQNPRVKDALGLLEDRLRREGILPPKGARLPAGQARPLVREPSHARAAGEGERLQRLEEENALLRAEVSELKRALEKFAVLREALSTTGRVPR